MVLADPPGELPTDVALEDAALRRPTLDDVFLALTGRTTDDATENAEVGKP